MNYLLKKFPGRLHYYFFHKVLLAKSTRCFTEPEESFCGNLRVEGDEECDAGLLGSEDTDSCCDENCKLRANAKCSDKNSPCCVGKSKFGYIGLAIYLASFKLIDTFDLFCLKNNFDLSFQAVASCQWVQSAGQPTLQRARRRPCAQARLQIARSVSTCPTVLSV